MLSGTCLKSANCLHYSICNRRDMLSKRRDTLHFHEQNHGNVDSAKFVLLDKLSVLKLSTRVESINFKIHLEFENLNPSSSKTYEQIQF